MTRQEVKDLLISAGVAEPTEDAINNFLNKHNAEVQKQKTLADKYKEDATKVAELQEQLDAINNQNLSELEKANKATETANKQIADLQAQIEKINLQKSLAEIGIVGDDADNLIGADGKLNTSLLGQIISNRETSAKSQMEKDLLNGTPNPTGGNKNNNDKTQEDLLVDSIAKSLAGESKSNDIVNAYL